MGFRQDDVNSSSGVVRDFVGCVLDEFEKLSVAVSALRDTAFAVGVLGHEAGVHGISLEDAGGLLENGFDDCGGRGRQCSALPGVEEDEGR
ncbi:hypothetical protein [Streptomyces sp. NPDC007206]|uniref:hypothetical protein n=1 Tax=Streptomyces sp. NPDC007206 TaxID=3154317 RepID=UPI0033CBDCB4